MSRNGTRKGKPERRIKREPSARERSMSIRERRNGAPSPVERVAGNGLLIAGCFLAAARGRRRHGNRCRTRSPARPPSRSRPMLGAWKWARWYRPTRWRRGSKECVRTLQQSRQDSAIRMPARRTICCRGTVTPNGLFSPSPFRPARSDPAQHKLVIHGLVKQPLVFTINSLSRYPMVTRTAFPRVHRQLGADVLQRAVAGHRPGAARARFQRRMDRRAALDATWKRPA